MINLRDPIEGIFVQIQKKPMLLLNYVGRQWRGHKDQALFHITSLISSDRDPAPRGENYPRNHVTPLAWSLI